MSPDPFGTADLRRRVLDGWAASAARFREDANAEEDFALTAYRDRLVVELAQNAADAAARAGVPGRLLLRLEGGETLVAANTGAPLDASGVEALSTLRASAKRDDDPAATVGRFGVGFAAVLAVTDCPEVVSTSGGVRWSLEQTRLDVASLPSLAPELERRDGAVPVLRLPWPSERAVEAGFDTTVVLPLRDASAVALARQLLSEVDLGLLLMLPALSEVVVDLGSGEPPRVLRASDLDVRTVERSGRIAPELLADRPTEERRLSSWSVRWATPRPAGVAAVLHAPTPTDEPVALPALLIASFPLDPSRRHVAAGPLRDHLVERAAEAYVDLVREVAGGESVDADSVLGLVPAPVAAGPLDAELRAAILAGLRTAAILPGGLRPDEAVAVAGLPEEARAALTDALPALLPAAWSHRRELDQLGVERLRLADVVDELASFARPVEWWVGLYEALAGADLESLSGLPVPLSDGRVVRGPRSVVVGASPELAEALETLDVRVADPAAVHPLLERLGAVVADSRDLLELAQVRAAVGASLEADDPGAVAGAVLTLVREAGIGAGDVDWLEALALPDSDGEWAPAGSLLLPGSPLAGLLEPGALGTVDDGWVSRWGADALAAVGVLATFAVVLDQDVAVDPDGTDHDLDGEDEWLDDLLDLVDLAGSSSDGLPPVLPSYAAVRDLDLVAAERWPEALLLLASDRDLRATVVDPVRVVAADGRSVDAPSYTAWWLRGHAVLAGRRPEQLRAAGTGPALAGLLDEAPDLGLDAAFLRAIGVVTDVSQVATSPMVLPLLAAGVDPVGALVDGEDSGVRLAVPSVAARVLAAAPQTYVEHGDLVVAGVAVEWWVDEADGTVHAATVDGLARGLAWSDGSWERRHLLAAVLAEPDRVDDLLAEDSWS